MALAGEILPKENPLDRLNRIAAAGPYNNGLEPKLKQMLSQGWQVQENIGAAISEHRHNQAEAANRYWETLMGIQERALGVQNRLDELEFVGRFYTEEYSHDKDGDLLLFQRIQEMASNFYEGSLLYKVIENYEEDPFYRQEVRRNIKYALIFSFVASLVGVASGWLTYNYYYESLKPLR